MGGLFLFSLFFFFFPLPCAGAFSFTGSGGVGVNTASEAGTGLFLSLSCAMRSHLLPGTSLFLGPVIGAAFQSETVSFRKGELLFVENTALAALVGGATFSHRNGLALSLFFGPELAFFFTKLDADWDPRDGTLTSSEIPGSLLGVSLGKFQGLRASGKMTVYFHFNERDDTISIAFEGGF